MNNSQKGLSQIIQLSALIVTTLVLTTTCANATEVITKYDVDARVLKDAPKLDVNESITVDFGNQPRHGLIRAFNPGQKIDVISTVDQKGSKYTTAIAQQDGKTQLRIGSPETTVKGSHTYKIHYTVLGAITRDGVLEWSPTGHNWEQPIEKFQLKLDTGERSSATKAQSLPIWYGGAFHIEAKSGGNFQIKDTDIVPGRGVDVVAELNPRYQKMAAKLIASGALPSAQSVSNKSNVSPGFTQALVFLVILAAAAIWMLIKAVSQPLSATPRNRNQGWSYGSDSDYSSSSWSSCSSSSSSCSSSSSSCSSSSCGGGSSW